MRGAFVVGLAVSILGVAALAGPRLEVDPTTYRFGEVTEGLIVRAVFELTNVGDAPLIFPRQPHTSCGCTSAPLPKGELAPGESMELVVYFDSTGFGGQKVARTVEVYSNDPRAPKQVLILEGYVREASPHEGSASTLYYGFYLLVDLRPPEAYARGHLLGAVNIPLDEFERWVDRLPQNIPVYLYDATGEGALKAARLLRGRGAVAARAIAGGLAGWMGEVGKAFFVRTEAAGIPPLGPPQYGQRTVSARRVIRAYQVVVDLRPAEEYAAGHIPGAVNVSPEALPGWLGTLPPIGDGGRLYIWLVDADGGLACDLAAQLRAEGYADIYCLVGGLEQWAIRYGDDLLWAEEDG
ncbi:rhodanese-like domain-containing protein [Candidatus Bipolaricaulota sp. J31]